MREQKERGSNVHGGEIEKGVASGRKSVRKVRGKGRKQWCEKWDSHLTTFLQVPLVIDY